MTTKNITIIKQARVNVPAEEQVDGTIAFQLCVFQYSLWGREMSSTLDTRIMKDGRQFVIEGDGCIPTGFELN